MEWFQDNLDLVFFVYGFSFVFMGIAILFQPRKGSSFSLSEILWLLAGFGFTHGGNEWLDMWALIKGHTPALDAVRWACLVISYVFIFEFGRRFLTLKTMRPMPVLRWLAPYMGWWAAPVAGAAILVMAYVTGGVTGDGWREFWKVSKIWTRYLYGFQGAFMAGAGFLAYYRAERERLDPLGVRPYFWLASAAFLVYGVLGGLIVSGAGFFPASVVNTNAFLSVTGVPVQAFRSLMALLAAFSVSNMLGIFNWEARRALEDALHEAEGARGELEARVQERTRELRQVNEMLTGEIAERISVEERQRLFVKVYENAVEGIVITDVEKKALQVNESFTSITGCSPEDVVGTVPPIFRPSRVDRGSEEGMWKTVDKNGVWQGEVWSRRKNGEHFAALLALVSIKNEQGMPTNYGGIFYDITERKRTEEHIENLAYYDTLTGLPNRTLFYDRLNLALERARRYNEHVALMFIDLDNFKVINDTLGHQTGDELLKSVADRIQRCLRRDSTLARLGGDEFTVILPDIARPEVTASIARRITESLYPPFILSGYDYHVTASIGICLYPEDGENADVLLQNADTAMYHAKEQGKDSFQFFSSDMNVEARGRFDMETALRSALEKKEFALYYQPLVDVATGRIVGQEALIRWPREDGRIASPAEFLPVAEQTGLITQMDCWVMEEASRQFRDWKDAGLDVMPTSVNISGFDLRHMAIEETLVKALKETGIGAENLELELTEGTMMEDTETTIARLNKLKSLGVKIAVDDFGTGYSSLAYLKRFPIDKLKIDRSFVSDCVNNPEDASIVKAIIALAHNLGIKVVAEGVETLEHLEFLRGQGCEQIQGYYFSEPLPAIEYAALLREGRTLDGLKRLATPD